MIIEVTEQNLTVFGQVVFAAQIIQCMLIWILDDDDDDDAIAARLSRRRGISRAPSELCGKSTGSSKGSWIRWRRRTRRRRSRPGKLPSLNRPISPVNTAQGGHFVFTNTGLVVASYLEQ